MCMLSYEGSRGHCTCLFLGLIPGSVLLHHWWQCAMAHMGLRESNGKAACKASNFNPSLSFQSSLYKLLGTFFLCIFLFNKYLFSIYSITLGYWIFFSEAQRIIIGMSKEETSRKPKLPLQDFSNHWKIVEPLRSSTSPFRG